MAAYVRVSTYSDEQLNSLEAQKDYYEKKIEENPSWVLAGIYVDEGITGTSYRHRAEFQRMIEDCKQGKVDMVLTKSVSRFARNTVDALNVIRELKEIGVGVFFERENVWTLDSKGEFLITLLTSLAQEEARSISENTAWGLRKRFADGKYSVGYKSFLGYNAGFEVNEEQLNIISEQMQIAIAENSRVALNQDEYEKHYAELTARYEKAKAGYDDIAEQIESKKAKRELFQGFIRTLEKQDGITYEFDAGIWSSLVQEVIVKAKDDIRFIFKNGFEVRV